MGSVRRRPERLAEKLRRVRLALGLSQDELLKRLEAEDQIDSARISGFETGLREPSLMILLRYARLACVNMEVLADDELDLPEKLPGPTSHEEIKRTFTSRPKRKR
ncbi:MAG TPA: helix-turn-helix transcriptional regulator [Pyrinomonadaceae bacterium]|nr:helix-turn-helix transcriptional regulator [Pyrinomonadaceae bacterium]